MTLDPRWLTIAREVLEDAGVPDKVIQRHVATCAQRLADVAEEFPDDIAQAEHDRDEAAYDAHIHRQIDEARGK